MKHLLLLAVLITSVSLLAQQPPEPCGTMPNLEQQLKDDPGLAKRMAKVEERMQQFMDRNQGSRSSGSVITIPVVFHIVHNGEPVGTGPNIADSQVYSQLEIMNEDFRRLNADTAKTRSMFKGVAANPQIEFCLATFTPDGTPTDGIDRIDGGQDTWSSQNDINGNLKPVTVWNSKWYLNFWVVDFGGSSNLLGYAQFPGGNLLTDGVVVGYKYIGRKPYNPLQNSYNYGRTATHEIGHWLNLRHIWGDGDCNVDDFVDDTPLSDASNFDCPFGENSCVDFPVDLPDMVENYMDYTKDTCMNTFSQGQVDRMRAALNTTRIEILSSPACSALPTFAFTGKVIDTITGDGIPFASVTMKGLFPYTTTADSAGVFMLPYVLEGSYKVYAGAWGYKTAYHANDTLNPGVTGYVIGLGKGYRDEFAVDLGWTEEGDARTGHWVRDIPIGTFQGGQPYNPDIDVVGDLGAFCYMTGNGGGGYGSNDVDVGETNLISPYFDLTGYTDPKLSFYRWFALGGGNNPSNDSLVIMLTNGTAVDTLDIATRSSSDLGQWVYRQYRVMDYMALSDSMQLIVHTGDRNPGHAVEAAFDVFDISDSIESVSAPVASFTWDGDSICAGQNIHFTNTSVDAPNTIRWLFPGGSPSTTTSLNPTVSFDSAGIFDVTLIVGNAGGFDTLELTNVVTVFPSPDITLTAMPLLCFGDTNGSLTLQVANGTPPYQYAWNTGAATSMLNNLLEGTYIVTVTDANGCGSTESSTFIEPKQLLGGTAFIADDGSGNGEVLASAVGGTPPYQYVWDDPNNSSGKHVTGLTAGTYSVTITDSNGCQIVRMVVVPLQIGINASPEFGKVSIVPNPANDHATLSFNYQSQGEVQVVVYNIVGELMERFIASKSPQTTIGIDLSDWPSGWYSVELLGDKDKVVMPLMKVR